jgi:hypothetical protein
MRKQAIITQLERMAAGTGEMDELAELLNGIG